MSFFTKFFDRRLRKELVQYAGFSLEEVLFVKRYIDGDDNALRELIVFREEREKRVIENINSQNFADNDECKMTNEEINRNYSTTDNSVTRTTSSAPTVSII